MVESFTRQASVEVGRHLLIAMSNTPASLALIEHVAQHLPEPAHTHITLMHYLQPMAWEHGGNTESQRELRDIVKTEEQAVENEQIVEQRTERYFEQASTALQKAGVPPAQIQTKLRWDDQDVANAVLNELRSGQYSTVVVGERHHDFLSRLLGLDLADVLHRQTQAVNVWVISDPEPHPA